MLFKVDVRSDSSQDYICEQENDAVPRPSLSAAGRWRAHEQGGRSFHCFSNRGRPAEARADLDRGHAIPEGILVSTRTSPSALQTSSGVIAEQLDLRGRLG